MSTKSEALKKREAELDSAKKKKKIKIIIIIAACVLLAALIAGGIYYFLQMKVDPDLDAGIDGAEIYFGETALRAKRDLGSPDRIEIIADDVDWFDYYYEDLTLFGQKTDLKITFRQGKLEYARVDLNKNGNMDLAAEIVDHMTKVYEGREGYSKDDCLTDYQYCNINTETSERSIACYIMDEYNKVTVDVVYGDKNYSEVD